MAVWCNIEHNFMRYINANAREDVGDPISNIPEERFRELYRMPPRLARSFLDEMIAAGFSSQSPISLEQQFCAVLHFYATGCYQRRSLVTSQISRTVVGSLIHKFSQFIHNELSHMYIQFPMTVEEKRATSDRFEELHGIPGIIGLIDGTHIRIGKLPRSSEWAYVNRKGIHSINTQIICDADLIITGVNTRYPGATHDSSVWKSCIVYAKLRNQYENAPSEHKNWLLGDSGYALQPYLLTPYIHPTTDEQCNFNRLHAKTRSKVERCIGVLKNSSRCLLGERQLLYSHERCSHIIVSCAVLHNYRIKNGERFDTSNLEENEVLSHHHPREIHTEQAHFIRNELARELFQMR